MTDSKLTPGLVMWPECDPMRNRLCVLISDVHCTDCTVGNQTAEETDWQLFFDQLRVSCGHTVSQDADAAVGDTLDELLLILNGDIVDLIRSSKWAQAGVYPWQRDDVRFADIAVAIMRDIVQIHAAPPARIEGKPYSGFFYWLRHTISILRANGITVSVIPIVGNHDKELQVVPAARKIFYEECLGMMAQQIPDSYRAWVAQQLGTAPDEDYPCLPVYFADRSLRLLATHGQWRDPDNVRATEKWKPSQGWQPQRWQSEQYRAFSEPCFGDTVAAGLLSHFIWCTAKDLPQDSPGAWRIARLLDEMDLYRPTVSAVARLLSEARRLSRRDKMEKDLRDHILQCFRGSLAAWLGHRATWCSASLPMRWRLGVISCLRHLRWTWVDLLLMKMMAQAQEPEASIATADLLRLPAFHAAYRSLGLRLHVEGHTHIALEEELRFRVPRERRSYIYVNLGAWRDLIMEKRNGGYRRRGMGRALYIFDLAALSHSMPEDAFRYYARDLASWSDRRDCW
ncbi:MAG: hypothetical protein A3I66_16225 [Burkholderiales bacterium RIFCSPLOWO2_02_FULL_57_36]|nr:MAG: hypothetical protein A3I66_16225 [Burkholderiales bacterium RIFCSPLOWO2_02_FULL_57_36]